MEDGQFALEVLQHINDKVNEFKEADGNLYAIYATPAENLCGLQVKQFREKYGIVENVSDRGVRKQRLPLPCDRGYHPH